MIPDIFLKIILVLGFITSWFFIVLLIYYFVQETKDTDILLEKLCFAMFGIFFITLAILADIVGFIHCWQQIW